MSVKSKIKIPVVANMETLAEIRKSVRAIHALTGKFIKFDKPPYQNIEDEYSAITERWEEIENEFFDNEGTP